MKRLGLVLLLGFACVFPACGSEQLVVSGRIVESQVAGERPHTLVVRTKTNEEISITVEETTQLYSFVEEIREEDFPEQLPTDVQVSVTCEPSDTKGMAHKAIQIDITGYLTDNILRLEDGTEIAVWRYSGADVYALQNGVELLRVQDVTGPENVYVGGVESFDDLHEAAQNGVREFYQQQGLLYEVAAELEKAYTDYRNTESSVSFASHIVSQSVAPTASSPKMMYFLTSVLLPIDGSRGYELRIGAAFDRVTGEYLSSWELFSCPPQEVVQKLMDIAGITDPILRQEMKQAFRPENIILFPENLEVCFQQGTLPSQEHSFLLGLDYDERLRSILHEWAVPVPKTQ